MCCKTSIDLWTKLIVQYLQSLEDDCVSKECTMVNRMNFGDFIILLWSTASVRTTQPRILFIKTKIDCSRYTGMNQENTTRNSRLDLSLLLLALDCAETLSTKVRYYTHGLLEKCLQIKTRIEWFEINRPFHCRIIIHDKKIHVTM